MVKRYNKKGITKSAIVIACKTSVANVLKLYIRTLISHAGKIKQDPNILMFQT